MVCLFEDYAINRQHKLVIGKVLRMKHGGKDFRRPVAYNDLRGGHIDVDLSVYLEHLDNPGHFIQGGEKLKVKFSDIVSHVNLTISETSDMLMMDIEELEVLQRKIQVAPEAPQATVQRTVRKKPNRQQQNVADDGRRVMLVDQVPEINDGVRHSKRQRRVIVHKCQ